MTPAEEVIEALVADCHAPGCDGRYAASGKVFSDYFCFGKALDSDKSDNAWECNKCGSITFDSCRHP